MKKLLLVGRWYIIEPLGILHLLGLAKSVGWEVRINLVEDGDFAPLYKEIQEFKPDLVGFSIWTGYHLKAFVAADHVRQMGYRVIIGGPHATFFTEECAKHADWVTKGEAFRNFRRILQGELSPGVYFDKVRVAEGFPFPDRDTVYHRYSHLAQSKIKSMMGSVGCPFRCSYCYAPAVNAMYGGFELNVRPVDQLIEEARQMKEKWPLELVYFQDDIFGYNTEWLKEFSRKWKKEIGVPWHCQIRLELARHDVGARRLDIFKEGGCTGITLAIESGNSFLREFVLMRPMDEELILDGCSRIKDRGLTLRLEQILAVPFSDIRTDLETLQLNNEINPEMAWTSILAPYGGTEMGTIATTFGIYRGNNDDLQESFFERSVLHHLVDGRVTLEPHVRKRAHKRFKSPLLHMETEAVEGSDKLRVSYREPSAISSEFVGEVNFMSEKDNRRYCDQTVMLQRVFNWLSMVPLGHVLGAKIVQLEFLEWSWEKFGSLVHDHIRSFCGENKTIEWKDELKRRLGGNLPSAIEDNYLYFCFFPSGEDLAQKVVEENLFDPLQNSSEKSFNVLGTLARRHLFERALYRTVPATKSIGNRFS